MKAPKDTVRRVLAGSAGDSEHPPFVQRTFPMRLRAEYDLGRLSAMEAEMDAEAYLDVTRRLLDKQSQREFAAPGEQRNLLELFGTLDWDEDYDYKGERTRS